MFREHHRSGRHQETLDPVTDSKCARHRSRDGGRSNDQGAGVQIKTIEPIAVSLPMIKPVVMAGEEIRRADNVLVRIEGDNGLVRLGRSWRGAGA